jgi:hypothetical protein
MTEILVTALNIAILMVLIIAIPMALVLYYWIFISVYREIREIVRRRKRKKIKHKE